MAANNFSIDPAQIKYLEFFAKADKATGEISLNVQLRFANNTIFSNVLLKTEYIDKFVLDSYEWSRVRIPVAAFGVAATTNISRIIIYEAYDPAYKGFMVDELRWIGDRMSV